MKKRNSFRPAAGLMAAVLLATPAAAIVYVMQTDEDMVRQSPVIVYGEVVDTAPARLDGEPATDARVRVETVLKGRPPGAVVTVRQPGGFDGGMAMGIMGLPMLSAGDRVLLFLDGDGEAYRTVGLGLGIFFEASHGGSRVLVREAPHLAAGRVAGEHALRDSARFRRFIGDRAAGRESRADYLAADLPDGPRGVASPYVLKTARGCENDRTTELRWKNFDTGKTLKFNVYGSQEEVADTMSSVKAAAAAWNGSGTRVSLTPAAAEGDAPTNFRDFEELIYEGVEGMVGFGTTRPGTEYLAYTNYWYPCDRRVHNPDGSIGAVSAAYPVPGTGRKAISPSFVSTFTTTAFLPRLQASGDADADFAEVITHELGHALGLDHSADTSATMYYAAKLDGRGAKLEADDIAAVRFLYPVRSASPPPPEQEPEPQSGCTLVAPYWSGPTGGFTVRPAPGRNSVSLTCGGRTTEYTAEDGLVTRLVRSSCRRTGLQLTGAAPGGWYWQHGDSNAAVAPLVCSDALEGPLAVVPGGVTADATDDGTLVRHDTARLIGIVPHLAGNECGEYVTPYWQGDGGVVVRPAEGRETVRVRVHCGRTYSTMTPSAGEDGVVAELVSRSYCTDDEGDPKQGRLSVAGAAPGGWYWVDGERNAAVGPLMCADLLGGPAAVDPGGVVSRATEDGTYFQHDADRLIGVVPHVAPNGDPPQ